MDQCLNRPQTLDGWLIEEESISTEQTQQIDPPESSSMQLDNTFDLFLSEEILSQIVKLTNQSYQRFVAKKTGLSRRIRDWYPIDTQELRIYLGVFLMMGIDKKPELSNHWSTHGLWDSCLIRKAMNVNRFIAINKYLEVGPIDLNRKLGRLDQLSNHIQCVSQSLYTPSTNLSIDESLIAFKGRNCLKQYLPMKPAKWGFKVFALCESKTGYCIRHIFYDGDKGINFKPYNIVQNLLQGFENSGYHVFADNWYTSINLVQDLKSKGICYTGTIRKTMIGMPKIELAKERLKNKNRLFLIKNDLNLILWEDKKIVTVISNVVDTAVLSESKIEKGGFRKEFQIPRMIKNYRQNMGGVDLLDQRFQYYSYNHSFKKWWKSYFVYLLEIAVNNSFILTNKARLNSGSSAITYIEYRIGLIKKLVGWIENKPEEKTAQFETEHYLEASMKKNCGICYRNGKRSSCNFYCPKCDKNMHQECFLRVHGLLR